MLHPEEFPECSNGVCIAGFSCQEGDSIQAAFMIPASQHYDITISAKAIGTGTNTLLLNGEPIGDFTLSDTEHFTRFTVSGIYLPEGQAELSVQETDGNFLLDYFEIKNNTELQNLKYKKTDALSDTNASDSVQSLYAFLSQNYGEYIITGQYAESEKNTELDKIWKITGTYPAIRFGDMRTYSGNSPENQQQTVRACENWAAQGGIVGLTWYWYAPQGTASFWSEETDFSLADAVSQQPELANLSESEIETALEHHEISPECAAILRDIDSIATALKPLAEQDIPVLWRPLPEAGGGWYWWGADGAASYRWLWNLLWHRMTDYHQLHNLIWVWNGQSQDFLVDYYDIAAMDIYLDENQQFQSRYEEFVSLYQMTKHRKILAVSECGTVPDMNFIFRDNTVWSFMGLWYGDYLQNTDAETLRNFYQSEKVLTLDKIQRQAVS